MNRASRAVLGVGLLFLLAFLGSLARFIWPNVDRAGRADAVIVLSGDHGERLAEGLRLMELGVAPTLVLNGTPDLDQVNQLCRGGQAFEVVCLRPDPDSTRTEAGAAGRLAADRRWTKVVVVTTKFHVTRSRLWFSRCVDADVRMVGAEPPYGRSMRVRQVAHEWLGFWHGILVSRGCPTGVR